MLIFKKLLTKIDLKTKGMKNTRASVVLFIEVVINQGTKNPRNI
jgi:hypothetical protein